MKDILITLEKLFSPEPLDQYPNLAKTIHFKEHASWVNNRSCLFSSPELKGQVSFSDHLSSVVCLSVRPSVCLSVNFSHFHLLLQNHWANFNQTWHDASLGEGDSRLFKWRPRPFPRGDYYKIVKIHWGNFKIFFSMGQFQANLAQSILGWRWFKFVKK